MTEAAKLNEEEAVVARIAADIQAYRGGGPDREAENLEVGREALGEEEIRRQWLKARRTRLAGLSGRLARVKPLRRRENEGRAGRADLILPAAQPRVDAGADAPAPASEPEVEVAPSPAKVQLPSVVPVLDQRSLAFQHSKSPRGIASSLENALIALNMLELDCRFDIYHDRMLVRGTALDTRGDVFNNLDNVTIKVRQAVLYRFGFDPGATFTYDALLSRCLDRVFDPVRDYLDGLRWDGKPRLDGWLVRYGGAKDTALNRAIDGVTLRIP